MIVVSSYKWMLKNIEEARPRFLVSLMDNASELATPTVIEPANHLKINIRDFPNWQKTVCRGAFPDSLSSGMKNLLSFGQQWDGKDDIIVHCEMGLSRSPAAGLILACQNRPKNIKAIALDMRMRSEFVLPNAFLIEAGDKYLGQQGEFENAIAAMGLPIIGKPQFPLNVDLDATATDIPNFRPYAPPKLQSRTNFDIPFSGSSRLSGYQELSNIELDVMLKQHELWLKSGKCKGQRAQFINCTFVGQKFAKVNLEGVEWTRCDMRGVVFNSCNLEDVKFFACDLGKATFNSDILLRSTFSHCHMEQGEFSKITGGDLTIVSSFLDGVVADDATIALLGEAQHSK